MTEADEVYITLPVVNGICVSFCLRLQQPGETRLFKVMIARQRLVDTKASHNNKAGAVNQAPGFVLPLGKKLPCLRVQRNVNMDDLNIGRSLQTLDKRHD